MVEVSTRPSQGVFVNALLRRSVVGAMVERRGEFAVTGAAATTAFDAAEEVSDAVSAPVVTAPASDAAPPDANVIPPDSDAVPSDSDSVAMPPNCATASPDSGVIPNSQSFYTKVANDAEKSPDAKLRFAVSATLA